MPLEIVGGKVTLAIDNPGEIKLSFSKDTEIIEILSKSTGRVRLTSIRQEGVEEYLTGEAELDLFKKYGNTYPLPESIPYSREMKLIFGLRNISNSENIVYIAVVMKY